ncbi:hypothetical protein, partial [Phytoactinopolyspora endophytica]|uniref:hypothetical protein n=1 Tax=Phytoactinopolyspora endophytica TaxID=1642495 RepID=UPI00197C8C77
CSGYRWDDAVRPREPSRFLAEIRDACRAGAGEIALWIDEPGDTNPLTENAPTWQWPYDPLGARRATIAEGAAMVRTVASGDVDLEAAAAMVEWDDEVSRLLAERDRQRLDRT